LALFSCLERDACCMTGWWTWAVRKPPPRARRVAADLGMVSTKRRVMTARAPVWFVPSLAAALHCAARFTWTPPPAYPDYNATHCCSPFFALAPLYFVARLLQHPNKHLIAKCRCHSLPTAAGIPPSRMRAALPSPSSLQTSNLIMFHLRMDILLWF